MPPIDVHPSRAPTSVLLRHVADLLQPFAWGIEIAHELRVRARLIETVAERALREAELSGRAAPGCLKGLVAHAANAAERGVAKEIGELP